MRLVCIVLFFLFFIPPQSFGQTPGGVSSDLLIWFKTDTGISTQGSNLVWKEMSKSGLEVRQSNSSNKPKLEVVRNNYHPGFVFGYQDYFESKIGNFPNTSGSPLDYFSVLDSSSSRNPRNYGCVIYLGQTPALNGKNMSFGDQKFQASGSAGMFSHRSRRRSVDSEGTFITNIKGDSMRTTGQYLFSANGNPDSLSQHFIPNNTTFFTTAIDFKLLSIGAKWSNVNSINSFYEGGINEIVVFRKKLGLIDRNKVNSYLALKFGITLELQGMQGNYLSSSSRTVFSDAGRFWHQIIGCAKDSASSLNQKQSHIKSDSLRIYLNSIAYSNRLNLHRFTSDNQFVVMGSDTGKMSFNTGNKDFPSNLGIDKRLDRGFKIANTNFQDEFSIDLKPEHPIADPSLLVLLVDEDDGVFANADTEKVNISYSNGLISIKNISTKILPIDTQIYLTLALLKEDSVAIKGDSVICSGDSLRLVACGDSVYNWVDLSNPGQIISQDSILVLRPKKDVKIMLFNTRDTAYHEIRVVDYPIVNLGPDTSICFGNRLILRAGITKSNFIWQNNSSTDSLAASNAGLYWLEANREGCIFRDSMRLSTIPLPSFSLGRDSVLCDGDSLTIKLKPHGFNYIWSNGSRDTTQTLTKSSFVWAQLSNRGCTFRDSILTSFNPVPFFNLGADTTFCENDSIQLKNPVAGASSRWSTGSTDNSLTIFSDRVIWLEAKLKNCSFRDSMELSTKSSPFVFLGRDSTLCEGDSISLINPDSRGIPRWSTGEVANSVIIKTTSTISLEINLNGCIEKDTIVISFDEEPKFSFGSDTLICPGTSITLEPGVPSAIYKWQDGTDREYYAADKSGEYFVELSRGGCSFADSIFISTDTTCTCHLNYPNAFSPNNDDVNDHFIILHDCNVIQEELQIYNRWGALIHKQIGHNPTWDGSCNGKIVPEGVFVFIYSYQHIFENTTQKAHGVISILRD